MDTLVTLLNPEQDAFIYQIWQDLNTKCGLKGIEATPIPHFSWCGADKLDLSNIDHFLGKYAADAARPFAVKTGGLGFFLDPKPVVYIPVVKNRELLEMHTHLWDGVAGAATKINPYYAPDTWVPHITLAQGDLTEETIACAVKHLISFNLAMNIAVDNLAIICQPEGVVGTLRSRYRFGK